MCKKRLMHAPVDESRHKKMTAERSSGLIDRLAYALGKETGVDFSVKEANRAKVSALFALDQAAPLLIFFGQLAIPAPSITSWHAAFAQHPGAWSMVQRKEIRDD